MYKRDIIFSALVEFMVYSRRQTLTIAQNHLITNLISTMKARSGNRDQELSGKAALRTRPEAALGLQEKGSGRGTSRKRDPNVEREQA